ncbi:hypothetical protein ACOSP7_025214 [Xanthoceras sorbifolium]
MDIDFWTSRVHSAKHLSAVQASRFTSDNHLVMDDSEGDDDVKACFPCPFCYVDIEVQVVCSHLQEEHCFDLKNAVCPLCAGNLGKDVIGHFLVQHASSLKRRRKSQKSGLWNGGSAMLGKELSSFLGSSNTKGIQQDNCSNKVSVASDLKSTETTILDEGHKEDVEKRRLRATFVQQLILSIVF